MSNATKSNQEPEPHLRHGRLRRAAGPPRRARRSTPRSSSSAAASRSPRPPPPSPAATSTSSCTRRARRRCRRTSWPRSASTRGRRSCSLASGESSALLEEALDADVADVLLLPQLTENVVFAIRKAATPAAGVAAAAQRPARPHHHRVLAEGRHRQDRRSRRTSRRVAREARGQADAAARPRPAVRRRRDHARRSSRRRRSTTSSSLRASSTPRSSPATRPGTRAGSTSSRRRCARRTPSSSPRRSSARLLEVARESYDVIVVDTSPFFHGPMLATLDRTDELLLALRPRRADAEERPAQRCRRSSCSRSRRTRIRVVLNRANSKVGMKPKRGRGGARDEDPASRCRATGPCRWPSTGATPAVLADAESDFAKAIRDDREGARRRAGSREAEARSSWPPLAKA